MVGVPRGVVWYVGHDLVTEALVEASRLEAEGGQEDAPATLVPGLGFGLFEQLLAVAFPAERLGYPEQGEIQPSSPDVPARAAQDRVALVLQEDRERAVVRVPCGRHVEEREAFADKVDVGGTRLGVRYYPDVLHEGLLSRG